ncbi:MAG: ABC transporter ATP-binding protein [Planctomycetota bacterium]
MTDKYVIQAESLVKKFPDGTPAVTGLDMDVPRGAVYGLMGKNGAGKTTTIRMLLGLLQPTAGKARVLGQDMLTASPEHRACVAYVSQEQQLHAWMTTSEMLRYVSYFYPTWDGRKADALCKIFDIDVTRPIGSLSTGQRRQVSIIMALAAGAEVVFLDEPAAGLDPIARRDLINALVDIISAEEGKTILFSTHIISDLGRIADHVGFIYGGRLTHSSSLEELQKTFRKVQIIFEEPPPEKIDLPGAINIRREDNVVTAAMRIGSDGELEDLRRRFIPSRVTAFPLGLEDIFIEMFKETEQK